MQVMGHERIDTSSLAKGFWSAPLLEKNVFSRSGADQKPFASEDGIGNTEYMMKFSLGNTMQNINILRARINGGGTSLFLWGYNFGIISEAVLVAVITVFQQFLYFCLPMILAHFTPMCVYWL